MKSSVGSELVRLLLERDRAVRAVVGEPGAVGAPAGAELFCGDMSSAADVERALTGVQRAFLEMSDDDGRAFAAGAARAGLGHVVLLSSFSTFVSLPNGRANCVRERYRAGEQALTRARLASTFLRCAVFDDDLLRWTTAISEGVVRAPFPDVRVALVDPADVAAAAAAVLAAPAPEPGAYVLTGPEQLSTRDAVGVLSAVLDRPLTLDDLSFDDALAYFPEETPDLVRRSVLEMMGEAASGLAPTTDVEHLTGRPARSFRDWASDHVTALAVGAGRHDGHHR